MRVAETHCGGCHFAGIRIVILEGGFEQIAGAFRSGLREASEASRDSGRGNMRTEYLDGVGSPLSSTFQRITGHLDGMWLFWITSLFAGSARNWPNLSGLYVAAHLPPFRSRVSPSSR